MAAISGGEVVGVGTIGEIYCRLLSACEHVADVRRAEEWLSAAGRLVAWSDFVAPTCRCHYGGILIAIGRWAEAEEELLAALRAFDRGYRAERISPLVRLAELRVRQGRFEEAERLLEGGEWHPTARRSLATIALARGDLALAEDFARLCFEGENPSDPACGPLLELLVGIQLARHDLPRREGDARPARRARRGLRGRAGARLRRARRGPGARRGGGRASPRPPEGRPGALLGPRPAARGRVGAARARPSAGIEHARPRRSRRRGSRSARSSGWARRATPTRRRGCSASSGPSGARRHGATER